MILPYRQCVFYSSITSPDFTKILINTRPLKSTSAHRNFQFSNISNKNMADVQAFEAKCRVEVNHGIVCNWCNYRFGKTSHTKAITVRSHCTFQFSDNRYGESELRMSNILQKYIKEIHCILYIIRVTFMIDISLYLTYLILQNLGLTLYRRSADRSI